MCWASDVEWRWAPESKGVRAGEEGGQPVRANPQVGWTDKSIKSVVSVGFTPVVSKVRGGEGRGEDLAIELRGMSLGRFVRLPGVWIPVLR